MRCHEKVGVHSFLLDRILLFWRVNAYHQIYLHSTTLVQDLMSVRGVDFSIAHQLMQQHPGSCSRSATIQAPVGSSSWPCSEPHCTHPW